MKLKIFAILGLLMLLIWSCRQYDQGYTDPYSEWFSGGQNTFFDESTSAFDHAFRGLNAIEMHVHEIGDKAFDDVFLTAPAPINSGLGPIYNNVSCVSCHVNDGRGRPPFPGAKFESLLFKLSADGRGIHGEPLPVNGFGTQLQLQAIQSVNAEAQMQINFNDITEVFPDGYQVQLKKPIYSIVQAYMTLPSQFNLSPRLAPPVFGLGLIEAIPANDVLSNEDIADRNADGISGKANWVWDYSRQHLKFGRFGWKAGQPTILQQIAGAYNEDMGVTNSIFKQENCLNQSQFDGLNDDYELPDSILHAVNYYMQTLAVPGRRQVNDAIVKQGQSLFKQIACSSCHIPKFTTETDVSFPSRSHQIIYPYTDLLLHDMGAELADNRSEYEADGQEWKTPALWGIGLTYKVNGHGFYMHDGRARSIEEAILWHGGEAEFSKRNYKRLSAIERKALIKFIESL